MKIVDMKITPVAVLDPPLRNSTGVHQKYALRTIVQLRTDDSLTGVGECHGGEQAKNELEKAKSHVIGADPFQLEPLRLKVPEARIYSPIEVACFDIMGKATGRPVCDLLGGKCRDRVPYSAYLFFKFASNYDDWGLVMTPEAMVEEAKRFVKTWGFKALKVKGGVLPPDEEIRTMKLLREAFGPDHPLRRRQAADGGANPAERILRLDPLGAPPPAPVSAVKGPEHLCPELQPGLGHHLLGSRACSPPDPRPPRAGPRRWSPSPTTGWCSCPATDHGRSGELTRTAATHCASTGTLPDPHHGCGADARTWAGTRPRPFQG